MKIAIVSDIHDHVHNLRPALAYLSPRTEVLICCGDLCSPFVMDELKKYEGPAHIVFGNNDADLFRITRKSDDRIQVHGEFLELAFGSFKLAANHFDTIALPIAQSGLYDLVCFGHNHRYSLRSYGRTIALNPGTLMATAFGPNGAEPVPATFAIFDTSTRAADVFEVSNGAIAPGTWERLGS
jgi:putative phosphoesterase